ncbi:MAG: hypothetical protein PHO42_00985 [Candidatus Omnitrophica bacterium]|nr:hypothetical protein [Candidatus Omnitrophota bacterium]
MKKHLIVLFFIFSLLPATSAFPLEIEPMRLEQSLSAGSTYSGSFKLINPTESYVDIAVSTGEYRYIFSEGTIPPEEAKKLPSCRGWLQFEKTNFNIGPGGSAEAKFLINVPKDAKEEHLCAVLFDEKHSFGRANTAPSEGDVRLQVTPRFSIPVYVSIKGHATISAEIKEITAEPAPQKNGVTLSVVVENTGTTHMRPFGTLIIFNESGDIVKNLSIGKSLPIFPGYKEMIPVICPRLAAGKYSAVATVELSGGNIIQKKTTFELSA